MDDFLDKWEKDWKDFEKFLVDNDWIKVSDYTNDERSCINVPIYKKSGKYIDLTGNFGYVDDIVILDENLKLIEILSKENFMKSKKYGKP